MREENLKFLITSRKLSQGFLTVDNTDEESGNPSYGRIQ